MWGLYGCNSQKIIAYEYVSMTRAGMESTKISKDSTVIKKVGWKKEYQMFSTDKDTWKILKEKSKEINLAGIDTLKSPSFGRQLDAAPHAYFSFYLADTVYQSASFDGGNPPAVLKPITNTFMKRIAEVKK